MPLQFAQDPVSHIDAMRRMIHTYSVDMPHLAEGSGFSRTNGTTPGGDVILLTGTTGALGSELLVDLLASERVSRVYAFNRPVRTDTIRERHQRTFEDRGLSAEVLLSKKLVFLEGNTCQTRLGLAEEVYEELRTSLTTIIHNAWQKGLKSSLDAFEPNIQGLRRLLDFSFSCSHSSSLRFLFISSVFVGQAWPHTTGWFPEESTEDPQWSVGVGYGEGKYVAERILIKAAENGLKTCSLRVGQISGNRTNGAWALNEWIPMTIKTSVALGCLPEEEGLASWISFDAVSNVVLDAAFAPPTTTLPTVLGVVHPRAVPWKTIIEHVSRALQEASITAEPLPLVRMSDWFKKLVTAAKGARRTEQKAMPALKILPLLAVLAALDEENRKMEKRSNGDVKAYIPPYDAAGLVILAHDKTLKMSKTLRNELPLGVDDARRWVGYWKKHGYFAEDARL